MANISLTRVNQKLNQARLLAQVSDQNTLTSIGLQAHTEAVAFHLMCAYQHYLRELAETYGLKMAANIRSEAELMSAFEAAKKYPVELNELIELRNARQSWLAQLSFYYDSLWLLPKTQSVDDHDHDHSHDASSLGLIAAVNIDPEPEFPVVTLELTQQWQLEFSALVTRHRQTSAEF